MDNPVYTAWIDNCPFPTKIIDKPVEDWTPPDDAGLVVTHEQFRWESASTLRRIKTETKLPILILCDGVLEYRNSWQNPKIAPGSLYQTLFGHKIACLGRAPARIIESFGHVGACEIVGQPRFDRIQQAKCPPVKSEGPFRLLVTTARTPAFTDRQHENVIMGLRNLKERFERNCGAADRKIAINWRLPEAIRAELGIESAPSGKGIKASSVSDAIDQADGVITTPSTVYLDSLIKRRPTAILDFNNCPSFVPSAWSITAAMHINPVLDGLADPPPAKMLFQQMTLHDQLELDGNSQQRLFKLFGVMIEAGIEAKKNDNQLSLPAKILLDQRTGVSSMGNDFDLQTLLPQSKAHQQSDIGLLQQELAHALSRIDQDPLKLMDDKLAAKTATNLDLMETLSQAEQRIDAANNRADEFTQQHAKMLSLLEIKRGQLDKKDSHIQDLKDMLQVATSDLKAVRQKFQKQTQAMLDAAAQLHEDVKSTRLDDNSSDSDTEES